MTRQGVPSRTAIRRATPPGLRRIRRTPAGPGDAATPGSPRALRWGLPRDRGGWGRGGWVRGAVIVVLGATVLLLLAAGL